jgi:hypothetical protein
MREWLLNVLKSGPELAATIGGLVALIFSVLSSFQAARTLQESKKTIKLTLNSDKRFIKSQFEEKSRRKRWNQEDIDQDRAASTVAQERVLMRIAEAKSTLTNQLSASKWSRRSANLLTIGQYIIGGLLASSFVQESLSPRTVGFLGVLVLLASLIKQRFRPEISAEIAIRKAAELKALIRTTEDRLAILEAKIASGQDHTDALITLLQNTTARLTEIEAPGVEQGPLLSEKPS